MMLDDKARQAVFDVVAYLVNSAPTSLRETPNLAAFRMVDAASRLLRLIAADDSARDEFARRALEACDQHFDLVMTDQDAFGRWLTQLASMCNLELMRQQERSTQ